VSEITAEDLIAAGLDVKYPCPECGDQFDTPFLLGRHRFQKHGVRSTATPDARRSHRKKTSGPSRTRPTQTNRVAGVEEVARKEVDKAVGNLIVIGGYLTIVLPHTGLAIAGDEGGNGRLPVQSRAAIAGDLLFERAKRDARVLEALQRFNQLFEGSAAAKLVVDMAAVVAVDIGVVDPHMEVEVGPFREGTQFGPLKPVEMVVGDVVAAVDALRAQYAPQTPIYPSAPGEDLPSQNGAPRRSSTQTSTPVVDGGVSGT
jgi:hypothetical protein